MQFIAAAVGEPKLLILDESFSGLDPVSSEAIREAILEMSRNGSTVVLSTAVATMAIPWMASRIFRVAILSPDKTPKLAELVRWGFKG